MFQFQVFKPFYNFVSEVVLNKLHSTAAFS